MTKRRAATRVLAAMVAALLPGFATRAQAGETTAAIAAPAKRRSEAAYATMVQKVAAMPDDARALELVGRRNLSILNVLWEDTGRWLGSSVGPNISDVTIEVEMKAGGRTRTALMPVIRHENFTDITGDVPLEKLRLPVGNHARGWKAGDPLTSITLREFLAEPERYLTLPEKGRIKGGTLLAKRDRYALVSAQATFLPVPAEGTATFWPVIFNYQSTKKNPAVLTLLVTRQGTSATIIDNARDTVGSDGSWGQRIFFNAGGERAPLTAERLSAVKAAGTTSNGEAASSLGEDANLLMLVQVPLKYREPPRRKDMYMLMEDSAGGAGAPAAVASAPAETRALRGADVEAAVLGHGPQLGPYTELDGLAIERDPRFPVRVTVQFYQATSNGVLSNAVVKDLAGQIRRVYKSADYVGSLVVPRAGEPPRPTRWDGISPMPPGVSWLDFPGLVERAGWTPGAIAGWPHPAPGASCPLRR